MTPHEPPVSRRRFLQSSALASALAFASPALAQSQLPKSFSTLKPLGDRVHPITPEEFHARLLQAQELMSTLDPKFDAILLGPGTSLYYFTGIHWGLSERLLALVIPRFGQPLLFSPAFEESRMRELMRYPIEVRVWQEDESPTKLIATSLADRNINSGRIGIDEALPSTPSLQRSNAFRRTPSPSAAARANPLTNSNLYASPARPPATSIARSSRI
jgi:Creatinase/Prolidase N-terminal domain